MAEKMVKVIMGESDWNKVIAGMAYLSQFDGLGAEGLFPADCEMIADSIQDVLDAR